MAALAVAVIASVGCGEDQGKQELTAAREKIRYEQGVARQQIEQEQLDARDQLAAIKRRTARQKDKYAEMKQQVADEQARLDRLERKVSGARRTIAKNSFPGDGTFTVGDDIEPGTYRASAREGCYWARLKSASTSSIIDNNNSDGPVVVEIKPSDKAFEASGCATFHKSG